MKNFWILILLLISVMLSGCADEAFVPVYGTAINEAGDTVTSVGGYVKDASISKESIVISGLTSYYNAYAKAHKNSGFDMEFALIEIAPGLKMYLPKSIHYRDEPKFETLVKPPTTPSEHPVWRTVEGIGGGLLKWGAIGYGIHEIVGFAEAAVAGAGDKYYGDSYKQQSDNTTTGDYSPMTFDQTDPSQNSEVKPLEDSFECTSGYVPLYLGGCSCSSYLENGHSCP